MRNQGPWGNANFLGEFASFGSRPSFLRRDVNASHSTGVELGSGTKLFARSSAVSVPSNVDLVALRRNGATEGSKGNKTELVVKVGMKKTNYLSSSSLKVILDQRRTIQFGSTVCSRNIVEVAVGGVIGVDGSGVGLACYSRGPQGTGGLGPNVKFP